MWPPGGRLVGKVPSGHVPNYLYVSQLIMNIENIAEITRSIADKSDWNEFMPTLINPVIRNVSVLEGIPSGVDHKIAAHNWMKKKVGAESEIYLAYKITDGIEICRCVFGETKESVVIRKLANQSVKSSP